MVKERGTSLAKSIIRIMCIFFFFLGGGGGGGGGECQITVGVAPQCFPN